MQNVKHQRYIVKASQQDCYYFFSYTTDKKMIEENKDRAIHDCFIADYGRISAVIVQDPTDFFTVNRDMIYEGDQIVFRKNDDTQICEIMKKDGLFYGIYQDSEGIEKCLLMTHEYIYEWEKEENDDNYDGDDNDDEDNCFCCECCGCTCFLED